MKNDGGPAFPAAKGWWNDSRTGETILSEAEAGMSLRDYFAAAALQATISSGRRWTINRGTPDISDSKRSRVTVNNGKRYAELAYRIADDMLAERAK